MPRFKVTFELYGVVKSETVPDAVDSKEAINSICDKYDLTYADIQDLELS